MADLKKKNTNKSAHIASRHIRAIQVDDRDPDNPQLVMAFDQNDEEHYLPITKAMYDMVKNGDGLHHPRLEHGLLNCSKFRFSFVTDEVKSRKNAEPVTTITAIHLIPDHPYIQCDWTEELGRRVDKNHAIVEVHPASGAICIKAFPNRLAGDVDAFLREFEKVTSINGSTSFKAGGAKYSVTSIYGEEITLRCEKSASDSIR